MIRLFAAVAVPEEIADELAHRQRGLAGARWRPADALHVTLRFFGELRETTAAELDDLLAAIDAPGFDLHLQGVGRFGEGDHMRAVWAGVSETPGLRHLAAKCETAAKRAGLKPEARTYRPHVTLAYLKRSDPVKTAAWEADHNLLHTRAWRATTFGLYSSWSGPDGSRYDLERTYRLR